MFNNYRHLNECYKQFLDCESFAMWGSRGIILFAKGGPRPIFSKFTMCMNLKSLKFSGGGGVWTPWHPLDQFMVKQRITVCKSGIEKINKIIENIVTALLQHI